MKKVLAKINIEGLSWGDIAQFLNVSKRRAYQLICRCPEDLTMGQAVRLSKLTGVSLDDMFKN